MPLNIYIIAHPIIKKLSNQFINSTHQNPQIQNILNNDPLHILLIYEVTRKWITGYNIYIKNLNHIKPIYRFNKKESYLIITNFMYCGNIINNINKLLPKVCIQHLNLEQYKEKEINDECINHQIINRIREKKIIIVENFIEDNSIIKLLHYLITYKNIYIKNINIICITCNSIILENLGSKYPNLKIYTTHINYH
uniref:Phosphoribosyltransferase domain-containing protein n=1 Tax=Leiomenia cribrosa TaxID=217483 RepID=A0A4D6WUR2_9FLOR|nr:hypothetical protein [Leiomenia cribrosa]